MTRESASTAALLHVATGAGVALLQCQVFEKSMKILLAYMEETGAIAVGTGSGDDLLERLDARTAGQLAAMIREHSAVDDTEGIVQRAVTSRNRIVHRFFLEHVPPPPIDAAWFKSVTDDLDALAGDVVAADELIYPHIARLGLQVDNVDLEAVRMAVHQALQAGRHA